jgi:hypothetical protein
VRQAEVPSGSTVQSGGARTPCISGGQGKDASFDTGASKSPNHPSCMQAETLQVSLQEANAEVAELRAALDGARAKLATAREEALARGARLAHLESQFEALQVRLVWHGVGLQGALEGVPRWQARSDTHAHWLFHLVHNQAAFLTRS